MLRLSEREYVALVEWTGQGLADGKPGSLPMTLRPVLEGVDLDASQWVETVRRYGGLYHRVAGGVETLRRKAEAMGQRWLAGVRSGRGVFRPAGQVAV